MAGATSGQRSWADTNATRAIATFWRAYFRETGATLISYAPTLSEACLARVYHVDPLAPPEQ